MSNHQIDISKPVDLPKDILIQFWRIATPMRGPAEGCSMNGFLQQGFQVINSYYPQTYIDFEDCLSASTIGTWTPHTIPETEKQYAKQIPGGECCAWEYGNYKGYSFIPGCGRTMPPSFSTGPTPKMQGALTICRVLD